VLIPPASPFAWAACFAKSLEDEWSRRNVAHTLESLIPTKLVGFSDGH
jgi:hypothetical protein